MASRRGLLVLGGFATAYALIRTQRETVADWFAKEPEFVALEAPTGFRRIISNGNQTTGVFDPFVGLDDEVSARPLKLSRRQLCEELYANVPADVVPMAYFSDYNCPYCRVLSKDLIAQERDTAHPSRIVWHELPLLGPTSLLGARAALAAGYQGAYVEFHKRLNTGAVRIGDGLIQTLAETLGVDHSQLLRDMERDEITQTLRRSKAVADMFGVIGTPFLVVGRTAVYGRISPASLNRLVEIESTRSRLC
ncbi:DSBA-like thioredoxin domain-containing protein [Litoreibacter meonggei]|uniref:DSBA-like thioredoxin domain-containing protein n=1 Tax=Litoreibacter meonggei TaxID=1049199 RepID=A0A497VH39_9RHOB|nr:DsbA family protein [Litoreibacter meonggei]RLJ41557.1 DSBA-like thioredoxin domain-containing protein [Litoreibacter meonggei]